MKVFFVVCLCVVTASRLFWFYYYVYRSRRNADPYLKICRRRTAQLAANKQTEELLLQRHTYALETSRRQNEVSILGGTIALAAWTVLVSGTTSAKFSGPSLSFLFLSGLILVLGPLVGRDEGGHLTYMVRESSVYIGFGSMLLALSSMANDLGRGWGRALAFTAAALLISREIMDLVSQLKSIDAAFPKAPAASLTMIPATAETGVTITADASASVQRLAPISTYSFDFGDDHVVAPTTVARAHHAYTLAGKYEVKATVTDTKGRSSHATRTVTVTERGAAFSYVGRIMAQRLAATGTTSVTLPIANASRTGNTLLVSVMLSGAAGPVDVTDSQGNRYIACASVDTSSCRVLILAAVRATALTAIDTITLSYRTAAICSVTVDEFAGVSALAASATATGPVNGATFATPAVTISGGGLLFSAVGTTGSAAAAFCGHWTRLDPAPAADTAPHRIASAYQIATTTGVYVCTGATTAQWAAALASFG